MTDPLEFDSSTIELRAVETTLKLAGITKTSTEYSLWNERPEGYPDSVPEESRWLYEEAIFKTFSRYLAEARRDQFNKQREKINPDWETAQYLVTTPCFIKVRPIYYGPYERLFGQ